MYLSVRIFFIIALSFALCGCGPVMDHFFPSEPSNFQKSKANMVSSWAEMAYKARCIDGDYTGTHISKIRIKYMPADPPVPNPDGPGKISRAYLIASNEGSLDLVVSWYGVTFTFLTTDEGIITSCSWKESSI